jgi:hypothetical protein
VLAGARAVRQARTIVVDDATRIGATTVRGTTRQRTPFSPGNRFAWVA